MTTFIAVLNALGPDFLQPDNLLRRFGTAAFIAVLVILFVECGLLVFFLPGDSLLFVTGLFIATGVIATPLWLALALMSAAAVGGNLVGYWLGARIGPPLLAGRGSRLVRPGYVDQTREFLDRHGVRSIVLARFVPIVRTFITAIAGAVRMDYRTFARYSALGGVLWVLLLTMVGFLIGDRVPWVERNIELIAIGIVALSVIPIVIEWRRARRRPDSVPPVSPVD